MDGNYGRNAEKNSVTKKYQIIEKYHKKKNDQMEFANWNYSWVLCSSIWLITYFGRALPFGSDQRLRYSMANDEKD